MRIFQIVVFVLASISFLIALYYAGRQTGDSFWKGGMAAMIGDIVLILLWPTGKRKQ
jgi:F0F1-type ATP synthase assembly protein I